MGRLSALDGLRGLAALLVFAFHAELPSLERVVPGLDAGVLVFFALSGYLLYAPFAAAHHGAPAVDIPTYALRRFLRIAPAWLVASFAIAWLWQPALLSDPLAIATTFRDPTLVAWTLQIEVVFYALLPVAALALGRFGRANRMRLLLVTAMASIGITVIGMVAFARLAGYIPTDMLVSFPTYLWAFVPGMVVAELQQRGAFRRPLPAAVAIAGLGLMAVSAAINPPPFFDLSASLGAAVLIAFVVSRPTVGNRFGRGFAVLGALSYSIYLWHEAIILAVDWPNPTLARTLLAGAITIVVAALVYVLVEAPAIRLGHVLPRVLARSGREALLGGEVSRLGGPAFAFAEEQPDGGGGDRDHRDRSGDPEWAADG
jgi:peptidoglycan/LPS O-acetylase OafA/YrhL